MYNAQAKPSEEIQQILSMEDPAGYMINKYKIKKDAEAILTEILELANRQVTRPSKDDMDKLSDAHKEITEICESISEMRANIDGLIDDDYICTIEEIIDRMEDICSELKEIGMEEYIKVIEEMKIALEGKLDSLKEVLELVKSLSAPIENVEDNLKEAIENIETILGG